MQEENLLTAKQVAQKLNIKIRTLYYLLYIKDGIPHYRIAEKVIRFKEHEVNEWLKTRKTQVITYPNITNYNKIDKERKEKQEQDFANSLYDITSNIKNNDNN